MTKKHFEALADALRGPYEEAIEDDQSGDHSSLMIANAFMGNIVSFCLSQNPNFDKARFLKRATGRETLLSDASMKNFGNFRI